MATFDRHTVYLVGDEYKFDHKEDRIAAVLSTENLLLNGYRQQFFGQPVFICVDTTYRIIVEGHGLMPIGTVSIDQTLHIIGYAVVSKEDKVAHEWVFRALKTELERIVNDRVKRGDTYI